MRPIINQVAPAPIISEAQAWQEIDRKPSEAEGSQRNALKRMLEAGEILIRLKTMTPHGLWLDKLKANYRYGPRMAQKLMRLQSQWSVISGKSVEALTLDEALDAIKCALEGAFDGEPSNAQPATVSESEEEVGH